MAHIDEKDVIAAARKYASLRQSFPASGWLDRLEQAGWELAEKVRAFDKQNAEFDATITRGDYCPVCHNNPNQQRHGPRCTTI